MVWQKTSGFRKHCRKRQVLRPWMPRRVPAHAAPRRRCPRHDNNQNRRCERLPTCPAKFFPRCKNGSKAAREQAEWLAGQPDDAEKSTEAERDEEQDEPVPPPDEVLDDFVFHRDEDDDFFDQPGPSSYPPPVQSTRSWARFEHGNSTFFMMHA